MKEKLFSVIGLILAVLLILPAQAFAATSGSWTPVTGVKVEVSGGGVTDTSHSSGTVTVKAKGSAGILGFGASAKTATIKITNESGAEATISCAIAKTSVNSLTASTGTLTDTAFSAKLAAGATATLTLTTGKNATENKVVLSGFQCQIVQADAKATVTYDEAKGSVSLGGAAVANGSSAAATDGQLSAVATPASSKYAFVAWINKDTRDILSTSASATLDIPRSMNLQAVFVEKNVDNAWFAAGGAYLYDNLNDAITKAQTLTTKVVSVYSDGVLPVGNYTIPGGVTLLIPFDDTNTVITNGDSTINAYSDKTHTTRKQYRQLTLLEDTTIKVASGGAISVGSNRANQFIGQVGPYGAIYMESGSNITVQSGGTLYVWGYIFHGAEGSGTVTVESGGTVYEPLSAMDYPGSASGTTAITGKGAFPLRSYSVRNVEVPMTLQSGAREYVFSCLYGDSSLVGTNPLYVLFIANVAVNGETPAVQNSGTITKFYVDGRMNITCDGNISLNSMTVKITGGFGSYEIKTSDYSGFYIPSCWDMTIASGTATMNDNIIACEGSTITINNGATVNTNGKNLYVLAAKEDPGAVVSTNGCSIDVQDVHGKYYTNVPRDAVLNINGTLIASGGFYTSTSGASIVSKEGTGVIQISGTSADTSVNVKNTNSYTSVGITAAQLKNGDGGYVQSATGTYSYCNDCLAWVCDVHNGHLSHATNVELGNGLNMYFAFWDSTPLDNWADSYEVTIVHKNASGDIVKSTTLEKKLWLRTTVDNHEAWVVYYKDLSAKQMGDIVTITLNRKDKDAEGNVQVVQVDTWSNSIEHYVMRMLSKHSDHETLRTLLVDMLNYGAACQNQFSYDTDHLVNAGLSVAQRSWASKSVEWSKDLPTGSTNNKANLIVDGNIQFAISGVNDLSRYSFTSHWGTQRDNQEFKSVSGYYYISKLYVADARKVITITAGDATWTDSVEAYCKRMIDSKNDTNGVCTAFMKFSDAAYSYLHNVNGEGRV